MWTCNAGKARGSGRVSPAPSPPGAIKESRASAAVSGASSPSGICSVPATAAPSTSTCHARGARCACRVTALNFWPNTSSASVSSARSSTDRSTAPARAGPSPPARRANQSDTASCATRPRTRSRSSSGNAAAPPPKRNSPRRIVITSSALASSRRASTSLPYRTRVARGPLSGSGKSSTNARSSSASLASGSGRRTATPVSGELICRRVPPCCGDITFIVPRHGALPSSRGASGGRNRRAIVAASAEPSASNSVACAAPSPSLRNATSAAKAFDSDVIGAEVKVADLAGHPAVGVVNGSARGRSAGALRFVAERPRREKFGDYLAGMEASGERRLDLALGLPLAEQPARVQGTLTFANSGLKLRDMDIDISAIDGRLGIYEGGLRARNLRARLLGQPALVALRRAAEGTAHATQFEAEGSANAATLARRFLPPLAPRLEGSAPWRGTMKVMSPHHGGPRLQISSPLTGVAVRLPEPLAK